jgi:hypothetical protein
MIPQATKHRQWARIVSGRATAISPDCTNVESFRGKVETGDPVQETCSCPFLSYPNLNLKTTIYMLTAILDSSQYADLLLAQL